MKTLVYLIIIVGAINWLLVGLLGFDLVAFLGGNSEVSVGQTALIPRIIYIIVGISGIASLWYLIMANKKKA